MLSLLEYYASLACSKFSHKLHWKYSWKKCFRRSLSVWKLLFITALQQIWSDFFPNFMHGCSKNFYERNDVLHKNWFLILNLHILCSKSNIFLTTYPPLNANVICEGSLKPNILRSKVLHHHFYLPKVIIQVQTSLEYLAG